MIGVSVDEVLGLTKKRYSTSENPARAVFVGMPSNGIVSDQDIRELKQKLKRIAEK